MTAIPITTVVLPESAQQAVLSVLHSGMLAQGPVVAEFERSFAARTGVRHAVAVNNGTTSLIASLAVLGLEAGDEVLTSPFTFVATLNAALQAGATVRFADISLDDFNLDPGAAEAGIGARTRVVVPVHLYGQVADMDAISALATTSGLAILEDAAQAHFARLGDRRAGSWGLGSFSFYATKNITTGEGGMVTTDDDVLADRLRLLRNQGMRARYQYEMAGNNYRMTDLQAAIGLAQLDGYDDIVRRRQANAAALNDRLAGEDWLITPKALPGRHHVWHQYTVLVRADAPITRDDLAAHLDRHGVGCGVYYPRLVHDYDCYRDDPRVVIEPTPNAAFAAAHCLSLPVHPSLTDAQIEQIADAVKGAVR